MNMNAKVKTDVRAIHNLVGHPLMQVFKWLRCPRIAAWVHDVTI